MYPARKTVRNSSFSLKELSPPVLDQVFTLVRFQLTNEFYGLRLLLVVDNAIVQLTISKLPMEY